MIFLPEVTKMIRKRENNNKSRQVKEGCLRCDGMKEVIELEENGLKIAKPAYPHTSKYIRYKCALCNGKGFIKVNLT